MEERIIKDINNLLTQLFQKMKESGYEWDAVKKELKKIEQKPIDKVKPKFKVGDKVNRNDREDEEYYILTIAYVDIDEHYYICDQDSVIDFEEQDLWHIVEQKLAWSEEDEKMLNDAIGAADYYTYDDKQEIENWLKSLKDRMKGGIKP